MVRPPAAIRLLLTGAPALQVPGAADPQPLAERDGALLAWLALEGATPRVRLAELLWPESDADAARNSLRQRLFRLKKQVGVALIAGQDVLVLAAGVEHDLDAGDGVLQGLPVAIGGEFGHWLAAQRLRRRGRLASALAASADGAERAGDWAAALAHAQDLLALEPLSEAAHRRVMRLHYLAGDRAAALLAFDRCERTLKNEVGARPDAQTLALLATIERAPARAAAVVPAAVVRPPRMIGRARELAALHAAAADGQHALVIGEGGMGKSRLLAEFAAAAAPLAQIGARPGDADLPYALLARLVRALRADGHEPGDALRPELARFVPELGEPARARFDAGRFEHLAERWLLALPPRPLVIDDLHFADGASVELLARLLAVPALQPLLLGLRPADGAHALASLLEAAAELPRCQRIVLAPLTEADLQALVDSLGFEGLSGAALAAPLARHTGGNPQFVLETLRTLLAEGGTQGLARAFERGALPVPAGVGAVIERRLKRLSPPALKLARVAAIAAGDFAAPLAARVLGVDLLDLADPWAELEAAHVLGERGFAHDLVYEAVRAGVPRAVARPLHAGVARVLQADGGSDAAIALHWLAAGEADRAAAPLARAAEQAVATSRLHEAAALYQALAGAHEQLGQRGARFAALSRRAAVLQETDAGAALDAALDGLQALAVGAAEHAQVDEQRARLALLRYEGEAAEGLARRALEQALRAADRVVECDARCTLAQALLRLRRPDEAAIVLAAIQAWVERQAPDEQRLCYEQCQAWLALGQDRYREAGRLWQRIAETATARGAMATLQTALNYQVLALGQSGRFAQAAEVGERERALIHAYRFHGNGLVNCDLNLAHVYALAGRYADALAALDRAAAVPVAPQATLDLRRGGVYLLLGQPGRAQPILERVLAGAADDTQRLLPALGLARVLHAVHAQSGSAPPAAAELRLRTLLAQGAHALRPASPVPARARQHLVEAELARGAQRLAAADAALALLAGSEAMALLLTARARRTQALLETGQGAAAAAAADDQLALGEDALPEMMSPVEPALIAVRALADADAARAARLLHRAADWLHGTAAAQVPAEFRDSFLHAVPAHRALLALASAPAFGLCPDA